LQGFVVHPDWFRLNRTFVMRVLRVGVPLQFPVAPQSLIQISMSPSATVPDEFSLRCTSKKYQRSGTSVMLLTFGG
jgi:hypothetical protein